MIVGAFAAGDLSTLRRLLAPDVLANFAKAIRDRLAAEQTMTTTLVSIDAADVVEARLAGTRRLDRRALRRQAGVGDARQGGRRRRGLAQRRRRPSRRLDVHARRRARAIPIGCWRRRRPCTEAGAERHGGEVEAEPAVTPKPQPLAFDALAGFADDDALAAFAAFRDWARAAAGRAPPLRAAKPPSPRLMRVAQAACDATIADAERRAALLRRQLPPLARRLRRRRRRRFLHRLLRARRRRLADADAGLSRSRPGAAARSRQLRAGRRPAGFDPRLAGAQRRDDGRLVPYPDRAAIEATGGEAVAWLADEVEVFFVQVQGSARLRLADGRKARLVYDGRNGQPYTSIGRLLIEAGEIPEQRDVAGAAEGLAARQRAEPGDKGRAIMQRNASYVFFRLVEDVDPALGPIGGAGIALTPLRSIAVDRTIWSYGLPFWIDAALPWESDELSPFRRLMIAHDTGSAIVGPARADIFFGAGEAAGRARRRDPSSRRFRRPGADGGRAVKETAERPTPARLRRLSDEEIALWIEVAKSVARRRGATLPTLAAPRPAAAAPAAPPPKRRRPPRRPSRRRPAGPPPLAPLERRLKRDLARGRAVVDSVLDLHGMTQAEAHHALRGFLVQAQAQGFRLVIVITGKGARAPADEDWFHETGVLRRLVPHWLREPDLRSAVLGFEEAGPGHGGAGALYVRLRRRDRR